MEVIRNDVATAVINKVIVWNVIIVSRFMIWP